MTKTKLTPNNLTPATRNGARFLDCDVRHGYAKIGDHFFDSYDRKTEYVLPHDPSIVGRMCVEVKQGMSVERFTLSPNEAREMAARLLRMAEIVEADQD